MASNPLNNLRAADHDLLIELRTEVRAIRTDVKDLKDSTTDRVAALESEKFNKEEALSWKKAIDLIHQDHETRIRRVERWGALAIGGLAVIQFLLNYFR